MNVKRLDIPEIIILEPKIFTDDRGFFYESFHADSFSQVIGRNIEFVQDNHSMSYRNVLRGMHYQISPKQQAKIVRVVSGEIFDVAVDIRPSSPTFGKWVGEILSSENRKQMWIPEGFAHGFLTLSETAEIAYKVTDYYAPELERCIQWNDNDINIKWPLSPMDKPILSQKDKAGVSLANSADIYKI